MKLKKLIVSASAIAAGSGILATVLTSCSKADIDEDLKIELNDEGKFANLDGATFQNAIKSALTRSSSWATFKQALADEIVYKWYENRASKDKNDTSKNTSFRSNLDEWKYQIDEDYDDMVDNLKSKYGANYKFYLQNEYLAANGGTEDAYKHAKLVDKVKSKFIDDAFGTIFFGIRKESSESKQYPHIFEEANLNIGERELNDPATWPRLGFYAKTDGSFNPGESMDVIKDVNYLAEKPQGDYATLQDYVFNRWFDTEKPFFSAAALFKYSAPNSTKEKKLTDIYNGSLVTIPDAPNEAFPFFGGQDDAETYKGTLAFYKWYHALSNGAFQTGGLYGDNDAYNGTVTIGSQYTEDSQTLLLCSAKNMIGGSDGGLYIPYGISAASLLMQLFGKPAALKNVFIGDAGQDILATNVGNEVPSYLDDFKILSNFFFVDKPDSTSSIKSYIDLEALYGKVASTDNKYHCPIFKNNEDYTYLYGDASHDGVKYITNNIQLDLGKLNTGTGAKYLNTQPWVLELNEAGVHAQTIDGYIYVQSIQDLDDRKQALKDVIKYRLMQKKCGYNDKIISADLIDGSNKLKTYFTNNFADIVLELALSKEKSNIFRNIEDYKETQAKNFFIDALIADQHFTNISTELKNYLEQITLFDRLKKAYDAVITANDKIYAYRKDQISNSKNSSKSHKKIFENGLTANLVIEYAQSPMQDYNTTHNYAGVNAVVHLWDEDAPKISVLKTQFRLIKNHATKIGEQAKVDDTTMGFSPQIKAAKDVDSNRFWYLSPIVDKLMYGYMGGSETANYIKSTTYDGYQKNIFGDKEEDFIETIQKGIDSTYIASKMLSGDKNYASYTTKATTDSFFSVMLTNYENWIAQRMVENGDYCDDVVNANLYLTTVAYLYKDNFANLFTALNNKIAHDESAFVGYVNKYDTTNPDYSGKAKTSIIHENASHEVVFDNVIENNFYKWQANVDNIYDQAGYAGGSATPSSIADGKISYDQYWHIVSQSNWGQNTDYAGFTGIQTAKTNQIDSASGLQDAAFKHIAKATQYSYYKDGTSYAQHAPNDGAFFAWAGYQDAEGKPYTFADVKNPDGEEVIKADDFAGLIARARKLARKIADASTVQDIKDIAKALGDAFHGDSLFKKIGYGQEKGTVDQLKYKMLAELLDQNEAKTEYTYAHAFDRLTRVELHGELSEGSPYCFESGSNGYKLMLTQINKSDIIEKTIFPVQDTSGNWSMKEGAGVTLDEFWYIFCSVATESSIQQLAIADAVKDQYGPDKLKVYDAQLYNQFDSVWIKDWVKKPIGGEGA